MCQQKVAWAVRLPITNRNAKLVLIQLCGFWTEKDGCFPKIERLAERTASSRATAERALMWLDRHGLITRHRTGRACHYSINFAATDTSPCDVSAEAPSEVSDASPVEVSDTSPGDVLTNRTNLTNPSLRSGETPHAGKRQSQTDGDESAALGWGPRAEISRLTGQTVLLAARLNRMLALSAELREMERIGVPALAEPEQLPLPMPPPRR